jgi:hypothetical protein
MSKDKLRLICKCGTIYDVCDMPIDVDDVIKAINASKCPSCAKSSKTACVYVEKRDEREER